MLPCVAWRKTIFCNRPSLKSTQVTLQWRAPHAYITGIPAAKKVDLRQKYRQLIPGAHHPMICPKPDDDTINKVKEQQQNTSNKRVTKLNTSKSVQH